MAIERIVGQTSAGPMIGGLDWRPPSHGKHSTRNLHDTKSQTDATHYTLLEFKGLLRYGLYRARPAEEMHKLPKGVISAAACFSNLVGEHAPNGALVLPVESGDERQEQKYLVVVLEDGVPHIDAVVTETAARDTMGSEERPTWAYSDIKYPNCELVDYEWLAKGASKAVRVLPIPTNPWPVVTLALIVAIVIGSWWVYGQARKAELARAEAIRASQNDPVPKYLGALSVQAESMATKRADVVVSLERIFDLRVTIPGWQLTEVDCVAGRQQCVSYWTRKGGTYQDIKAALPSETLVPVNLAGSNLPALDQATTVAPWPVKKQSLLNGADKPGAIPSFDRAMNDVGPLLQVWRTAGLDVELKPATLWPAVEGVPPEFKHPSALLRGEILIGSIPGPFIKEVLETAPPWIQWESLRVDLSEGNMRGRLNFKVMGNYYVSSN